MIKKKNNRYHTDFLTYLKKTFPHYDKRKLVKGLWKARCKLRCKYPHPEYLVGFMMTGWKAELRDKTPFDFSCFDDFLSRYIALEEPFFLMNSKGDFLDPDTYLIKYNSESST